MEAKHQDQTILWFADHLFSPGTLNAIYRVLYGTVLRFISTSIRKPFIIPVNAFQPSIATFGRYIREVRLFINKAERSLTIKAEFYNLPVLTYGFNKPLTITVVFYPAQVKHILHQDGVHYTTSVDNDTTWQNRLHQRVIQESRVDYCNFDDGIVKVFRIYNHDWYTEGL